MKTLRLIKSLSSVGLLLISFLFSSAIAQEYDDMYFSKSDRKTVKKEMKSLDTDLGKSNYKEISQSTEAYSSKNVNPEYIAKYKSTDENQTVTASVKDKDSYDSDDYFVEDYDKVQYTSDPKTGEINYAALNKRDEMSTPYYKKSYSNSSWGYNPYMTMGMAYGMGYGMYGMGYGMPYYGMGMGYGSPYYGGYDPFMMGGCGSCMSFGMGYGSGFGAAPFMSYSLSMSWGTGYPAYGYNPYRYGYNPYYAMGYYPGYNTVVIVNEGSNAGRVQYQPRTSRSSTAQTAANTETRYQRSAYNSKNIRVPQSSVSSSTSNGRVNTDYSKAQNEYYNAARRSSSSSRRISTVQNNRNSYSRSAAGTSSYSAVNSNKPVRSSNSYSSGYSRPTNSGSSYSGFNNGSRSSSGSTFSAPSRSSGTSYSGNSGARSSSYSSGSRSSSSSGSRSRSR